MLEYKQKRNNGRTPFAGVYKFVCVCVRVYMYSVMLILKSKTWMFINPCFFAVLMAILMAISRN